jgi:hypothetical protein
MVLKNGVSEFQIFKYFLYAYGIVDLSFKYIFFSASLLKKKYTKEKGFTSTYP